MHKAPPRARALCDGVPESIDDLISRCMNRDPRERPADAREFLSALSTARSQLLELEQSQLRSHRKGSFPLMGGGTRSWSLRLGCLLMILGGGLVTAWEDPWWSEVANFTQREVSIAADPGGNPGLGSTESGSLEAERARTRIAVMPLATFEQTERVRVAARSVTEGLITSLAQAGVRVPGWTAVSKYAVSKYGMSKHATSKHSDEEEDDARSIARDLGVDYLLEGSLVPERLTLRLLDGETQEVVWVGEYSTDDTLDGVLAQALDDLQRDICFGVGGMAATGSRARQGLIFKVSPALTGA